MAYSMKQLLPRMPQGNCCKRGNWEIKTDMQVLTMVLKKY